MNRIEVELSDNVIDVIRKIRRANFSDIQLSIPKSSVLFENSLNLKLIRKEAEISGKIINFETLDPVGMNLIKLLDQQESPVPENLNFVSPSAQLSNAKTTLPKFSLPRPNLDFLQGIQGIKGKGLLLIIPILLVLVVGVYFLVFKLPTAKVGLAVSSQPLVKSVTIVLSTGVSAVDFDKRIVPGKVQETSFTSSSDSEVTGTKQVGDPAKGKITIYNKTSTAKTFAKGTSVSLVVDKETLKYLLDAAVTVPQASISESATINGKADVAVTSESFGPKYNLDDKKTLKVDGFSSSDYSAVTNGKITGGTTKTVKVVAAADLTGLSDSLFNSSKAGAASDLKKKLSAGNTLIDSAVIYKKTSEVFDKKVGDAADTLNLTQTLSASGIYYSKNDLQKLLDKLLTEFVPAGFELSEKDTSTEVGLLTTVAGTTLPAELQLEVKIKAYVVPKVDSAEIRKTLAGGSIDDGKKYLAGIKNIQSYNIELWPQFLTFLNRFPAKEEKIEVEVTRE